MANATVRNILRVSDKRRSATSPNDPTTGATLTNVKDVAAMRARLAVINPTSYTAERLDAMTANDMLHAIRLNDEAASI